MHRPGVGHVTCESDLTVKRVVLLMQMTKYTGVKVIVLSVVLRPLKLEVDVTIANLLASVHINTCSSSPATHNMHSLTCAQHTRHKSKQGPKKAMQTPERISRQPLLPSTPSLTAAVLAPSVLHIASSARLQSLLQKPTA